MQPPCPHGDDDNERVNDSRDVQLLGGQRRNWYRSLPYMVKGDIDAFVSVFSNNMATMLVGAQILTPIIGSKAVFDHVVPGIAMSMVFGCVYYVIQAQLKSSKTGRVDLCAQPFGINTPGVFAFQASIIAPVYFANGRDESAMKLAWHVGIVAKFCPGCCGNRPEHRWSVDRRVHSNGGSAGVIGFNRNGLSIHWQPRR